MQIGFWAGVDGDPATAPAFMIGTTSPEDAAGAYAQQRIEQSEGAWTEGAVRVWSGENGADNAVIFDVTSRFIANEDDEDLIDCELEIVARD